MKYPYIAKLLSYNSKLALFTSPNTATALTDNFSDIKIGESDSEWDEDFYTNITNEYLTNTWGVVESKEHAEFTIELAESHGIELAGISGRFGKFFAIDDRMLIFLDLESVASRFGIKITIPSPPKAKDEEKISYTIKKGIQHKKGCEDFELTGVDSIDCVATLSVSFNDNDEIVNVECESSPPKAKEWPQVDDEVLTSDEIGVVKSPQDSKGLYAVLIDGDLSLLHRTEFEKPKSKQELLIEELQTKLCNNNAVDNYILACDIINGEIKGLSYEDK